MKRVLSVGLVVILALAMGMEAPQTQARVAVPQPLMDAHGRGWRSRGHRRRRGPVRARRRPAPARRRRQSARRRLRRRWTTRWRAPPPSACTVGEQVRDDSLLHRAGRTAPQLEALATTAGVASINEDGLRRARLATACAIINAPAAWTAGLTGAGWAVAILDTGVETTHTFLGGRVVSEACYSDAGGAGRRHVGVPRRRRSPTPRQRRAVLAAIEAASTVRTSPASWPAPTGQAARTAWRRAPSLHGHAGVHPFRRSPRAAAPAALALHRRLRRRTSSAASSACSRRWPEQRQPDRRGQHEPRRRPPIRRRQLRRHERRPPRPRSTTCGRSASPRSSPSGNDGQGRNIGPGVHLHGGRRRRDDQGCLPRRPAVPANAVPGQPSVPVFSNDPRRSTFSPRESASTRRCRAAACGLQRHLDGHAARRRRLGGPEAGRAGRDSGDQRPGGARSHRHVDHRAVHAASSASADQRQRRAARLSLRPAGGGGAPGAPTGFAVDRQRQPVQHDVGAWRRQPGDRLQAARAAGASRGPIVAYAAGQRHLVRGRRARTASSYLSVRRHQRLGCQSRVERVPITVPSRGAASGPPTGLTGQRHRQHRGVHVRRRRRVAARWPTTCSSPG